MPIAWHPNFCIPEDEEKEIDPKCIEELYKCVSVVYNVEVLKYFVEECVGSIQLGGTGTFYGVLGHFG